MSKSEKFAKRLEYIEQPGNLDSFFTFVEKKRVNISYNELIVVLPKFLNELTEIQKIVFRMRYFNQLSIKQIKLDYQLPSYVRVEKTLMGAERKIIKFLLEEYGGKL